MALMKKQDSNNKKKTYKKETSPKEQSKNTIAASKENAASKEKKVLVKKDAGKIIVRKDKVNRVEQIKKFLRGVLNELKKVHWLNGREVVAYTAVVLLAVVIVGSLIWLFDEIMSRVLGQFLPR
ncbi:preprotein translocase subunit SecE [Pelotomaculum terephthalicicum JT]|uniref:preprotein translocase subunit SecE n=1 Tax=Pelotomaculum TaxID=191373 RepID=UPI0009C9D017|nr:MULTISPECIES: preprotein translocase subunit SecE [Pelotomaculum]MCG9969109.1 preprotein translocase subunit SecE [Pelotomaculum terephthalicicum JT]OPX89971.1 MAG: preprotein translocase subunit SecE [Pelotomaculum sp. PtaB.Bin117]